MKKAAEKASAIIIKILPSLSILIFVAALSGCATSESQSVTESASANAAPTPASTPQPQPEQHTGPTSKYEVQAAIIRAYEGTVVLQEERFFEGDFDGDGSQDLIAVVKPLPEKLPKVNDELARWRREDPRKVDVPRLVKPRPGVPAAPAPIYAAANDFLLAVVHGDGPNGWRSPDAMNTFLLKNAVGNNIRLEPLQAARAAMGSKDQSIRLRGDVIQQRLGGQNGFILWNGVDYTWYAPGITKVAAPRTIHAKAS